MNSGQVGDIGVHRRGMIGRPGRAPASAGSRAGRGIRGVAGVLAVLAVVALGGGGCVPVAAPRFPQSVAAALAQHPMRTLESAHLRLYFPEGREAEARSFLVKVEGCAAYLTRAARIHNGVSDQKMIVLMPELPYNNAFVAPRIVGYDTEAVVPTYNTTDVFTAEMGLPPDPAAIACHELTHYVHFQQIAGFSWFWNAAFGAVYTPQIGLDSWFDEGLAVYYETKLHPRTGRLSSPFWRGAFAAGFAGQRINGGDLHALNRAFHAGNHYLVGSQFVRFLADRYGEDKLWRLVEVQGRSIFFPLWVDLRFWQVYDKSLSTLIDEFADEVQANLRPRSRGPGQRVVRAAGDSARYARAGDGTEALITQDHDRPPRLLILAADGRVRRDRVLTEVIPPRRLAIAGAVLTSGLSFTGDGRSLFFVALDLDATFQAARLLRYDLDTDQLTAVSADLRGTGGSVSPDGARYLFAQANGDHHDLAALDLKTGAVRVIAAQPPGSYVAQPRVSPDGRRVVASQFDGARFRVVVYDAHSGAILGVPAGAGPEDGPVSGPSWVDDRRILFLGTAPASPGFQVYVHDLKTAGTRLISDAPYLAFEARAVPGGAIRFLNREGWGWTLDEVALPALEALPGPADAAPTVLTPQTDQTAGPAPPEITHPDVAGAWGPAGPPSVEEDNAAAASDQPYSPLDHLFVPRLFGPTLQTVGRRALSLGLVASGNDRLSKHRWTLAGYYQAAGGAAFSGLAGYSNRQLAPFTFSVLVSQIQAHDVPPTPPGQPDPVNPAFTLFRRDRLLTADVTRAFYGNPITLGASLIETYRPDDAAVPVARRRFAGPHASASYAGVEATPYTGPRRAMAVDTAVAVYPRAWNTADVGFTDVRAQITGVIPLPLLRRHTLSLSGRARDLVGLSPSQPLLVVGGYSALLLGRGSDRSEIPAVTPAALPPGVSFAEPLRGFEDHSLRTDRVFIADATYRYPFVIDWGTASTLALLPALFVQQVDLELFGAGASDGRGGDRHLAGGAALTLSAALWQVSLSLQYQVARRVTDDQGLVHLVTLGL